ncbi:sugar transferase (PEP-CTERM/EpsH1 system associated) [Pseudoduganella flava]|uniref:Sugar transferase (PEP-CTERM/EpsH1 system associated) n=1 Tax=Pseudoduganella flava TaxID=871742 RepID=A0A562PNQ3_9BURK|nr:TIGR03088 family PEP-CTERM/XrtA system glycosyltransferase [Pseudoduganella flava]QGZ40599.1 TIGR03088 family PEP-CTERM/XrtA system glycosyltransferase [Pseudoduganella flava]TWI46049.1 sugar transferase (PEP-CTERM/EpsH1 system associated) [Pseudoduganella flava]
MTTTPLIVHLIYRLDFGGLETLLVERINRMPAACYRHAIVCLTDANPAFAQKLARPDVAIHALHKKAGLALGTHVTLWRLLRRLRPAVLHSYNLSAVEYGPVALLAGVPVRINGAHGRDADDPHGTNRKHNALRRLMVPFYDCCYANSAAMEAWNRTVIGVPEHKSTLLANGIDAERFRPRATDDGFAADGCPYGREHIVIGTVGRIQAVKDHATLVDAFALLRARLQRQRGQLRLVIAGDGPLLETLRAKVAAAGLQDVVWLPGARTDVPQILRGLDVFAMSSIAEGTPGSALEAMASALPVVGTRVGGIPEVVDNGVTGFLVPPVDPEAMAAALEQYVLSPELAAQHGAAGRERVLRRYSMTAMVAAYQGLYDSLCERKIKTRGAVTSCAE